MTISAEATPLSRPAAPTDTQRLILHGVRWITYQQLLADFADSHAARFTYDRGTLEIMTPSFIHETCNDALATIVETLAEELGLDLVNAGSTTFKRADLERGVEPDTAFYIQQAARVRGKRELNLSVDPPPDLVVEIDLSSSSLDKLPLYAAIGVSEIWRYDSKALTVFSLDAGLYHEQSHSKILSGVPTQVIQQFLDASRTLSRPEWLRSLREWARRHKAAASP